MKARKNINLLKGKTGNQHSLYGKIKVEDENSDFQIIRLEEDCELRHENPNGSFAQNDEPHHTLKVEAGTWVKGKQIEYNPFKGTISQIWD